jgi:hypothetical protein
MSLIITYYLVKNVNWFGLYYNSHPLARANDLRITRAAAASNLARKPPADALYPLLPAA